MIEKMDILDALSRDVVRALPELLAVYINVIPENYARPSAYIELGDRVLQDAGAALLHVKQPFHVEVTDELGENYEARTDALSKMSDKVEAMLAAGYLRVADRRLHIEEIGVLRRGEVATISASLNYFDDRPGRNENAPLMENIDLNTNTIERKE